MKENRKNPMLELRDMIYEKTGGMCLFGIGPYGIGMSVAPESEIQLYLHFEPEQYNEQKTFPADVKEYMVKVIGCIGKEEISSKEDLEEFKVSENKETSIIANALNELQGTIIDVTREECIEAFKTMAEEVMKEIKIEETLADGMVMA